MVKFDHKWNKVVFNPAAEDNRCPTKEELKTFVLRMIEAFEIDCTHISNGGYFRSGGVVLTYFYHKDGAATTFMDYASGSVSVFIDLTPDPEE